MLIKQIIEFKLKRPGPPGRTCTPITGYFHDKTKISTENLWMDYYYCKNIAEGAMYLTFPCLGQITYKI